MSLKDTAQEQPTTNRKAETFGFTEVLIEMDQSNISYC